MSSVEIAEVLVLAAAALHAGFQLTVTALVYPALLRSEPFAPAHRRHSRGIVPLVVVVYGALVATGVLRVVAGALDTGAVVALLGAGVAGLTTALVAAPTHARLSHGRTPDLTRRLLVADRVRTTAAVIGALGALAGAVS